MASLSIAGRKMGMNTIMAGRGSMNEARTTNIRRLVTRKNHGASLTLEIKPRVTWGTRWVDSRKEKMLATPRMNSTIPDCAAESTMIVQRRRRSISVDDGGDHERVDDGDGGGLGGRHGAPEDP